MSDQDTLNAREEIAKQKDQVIKKVSIYVLLTVATALSVVLWIYHGFAISLGFIFLEVQFLMVIATMGTSVGVLEQINKLLMLLTQGDVDLHYPSRQTASDSGVAKSREVLDKVVEESKVPAAQ